MPVYKTISRNIPKTSLLIPFTGIGLLSALIDQSINQYSLIPSGTLWYCAHSQPREVHIVRWLLFDSGTAGSQGFWGPEIKWEPATVTLYEYCALPSGYHF